VGWVVDVVENCMLNTQVMKLTVARAQPEKGRTRVSDRLDAAQVRYRRYAPLPFILRPISFRR